MKLNNRLVPFPVHPDARASYASSLYNKIKNNGTGAVYAQLLDRYSERSASTDSLQNRINTNLGKAFEPQELALLVQEEVKPVLRAVVMDTSARIDFTGTSFVQGTPEIPPGLEELWNTPWIYRNFEKFSEILWGQDWNDIDPAARIHGRHIYGLWLDLFIQSREDIQNFLAELLMSIQDLIDVIHDVFDQGGDILEALLEDLSKWLFKQFGFSF